MKKLQKEFSGNYDKVGLNKFVQIRKENGVAMYQRFNTDGTHRSYEVFIVKVIPKGAPLPNGKTVEESYESYPGSAQFGRIAYDCRTIDQAEDRFDELVEKVKISTEAKEEAIKTGKTNKGRRATKKIAISTPKAKFTMKMLVSQSGLSQPQIYPLIKQWLADGIITIVDQIKPEGKGRPAMVYQPVAS